MAKKKSKRTKKISKIARILFSSNDEMKVKKKYFNDLTPEQINSNIVKIKTHRFFKSIIDIRRNEDYSKFYIPLNPKTDFIKSLYWYLGVLETNKDKLCDYLDIEGKLCINILNSKFPEALENLDNIDDVIGISMASMAIRGGIFSIIDDSDSLNELSKEIDEKSKDNNFVVAIAKSIISRHEDSGVFMSNSDSFRNQILRNLDGELLHFILYKLTLKEPLAVYNYEHILNIEKNSTILDMYICLTSLIESFYKRGNNQTLYAISRMSNVVSTPLLQNLSHKFELDNNYDFVARDNEYIDLYTKGEYRKVVELFSQDDYFLEDFQFIEIAAKAATRAGTPDLNGLKGQIIKTMMSLMTKDDDYEKSLSYLLCLCHCFAPLRWFGQLRLFVENEAKELSEKQKKDIRELSILQSRLNSPRKLEILSGEAHENYLRGYRENIGDSLTLSLLVHKNNVLVSSGQVLDEVEKGRLDKYVALHYLSNKDYGNAIDVLEKLVGKNDILLRDEASKMLIDLYLELNNYDKASEEFVSKCLTNKNLIPYYNSEKICDILKGIITKSDSINIPIVFSLHSRFVNDNYDSALRFSFENFLTKNKIKEPLQGNVLYEKYDEKLVDYFFEYVCTPDVMKLYHYFDSTKKIENCRIEICNHLINKEVSKDLLIYEVKERTKKLVITDAAKHVENSRIYSDTSVFHSEITTENILNLHQKYLDLTENDYTDKQDEITLKDLYNKIKDTDIIKHAYLIHMLETPLNEKNKCFLNLISVMRDEFCYGDKGLNNYLSTRIRHGHLPTTLRKSVLDEKLVTKRLAKSQAFRKNEYWLNKLVNRDEREVKKTDRIFTEFSSEYEKVISEINDKWIQIFTLDQKISSLVSQQAKSEGLFNYSISNIESYIIQQKIPIKTEYSEFVKHVVNWLWSRTDINLKSVRDKINTEARTELSELLNKLQKDINSVVNEGAELTEFNDSVGRAKASLSANVEHITSWFERSDEGGIDSYEIETAIEIARRSTNVNVDLSIDKGYKLKGSTLTNFVDCLYIFFENAISKSNINKDEIDLKLLILSEDNQVKLKITNKCQTLSDVEQSNIALDRYREKYGQSKIEMSKLQQEGGSGFFKIWNIIHNGLGLLHTLRLGFEDSKTFSVELTFFNFDKVIEDENTNS
ncbi:hypothetical protein [uncultured Desulfuromusa sp.]|uniref:hypothetical protein n=1 Tax=uncultured Desulfuromusa sp. TaxID=219183 RepID=UPI002AA85EEE|nr:hypothetical protein [uncultured Desulfuromusa sp.]